MSALIVGIFLILDIEFPLCILIASIANMDTLLFVDARNDFLVWAFVLNSLLLNNDRKPKPANLRNDSHVN